MIEQNLKPLLTAHPVCRSTVTANSKGAALSPTTEKVRSWTCTLSVLGGAEIARRTFNPRLGIVGGISILGSSGVVEPMSERAIVETTALEIRQAAADGNKRLILLPGNYGMDYLTQNLPELSAVPRAKCSNYIGDAVDAARLEGFEEVILIGHIGKLVKLAGGIMNTHSKTADCRRELFVCHAALCGADAETCRALMDEVTSDGCLTVLDHAGLRDKVMESLLRAIQQHLEDRISAMIVEEEVFDAIEKLETTLEKYELKYQPKNPARFEEKDFEIRDYIIFNAYRITQELDVRAIVCFTEN
jgi:cobalamin biosynthesis protein CbiD